MGEVIRRFEKANPDIRVKWTNISGYGNLNTAIQDGYGTPDVACPHEARDTERMAVTAMVAILLIRCPITRMVTSVLGGA